MHNRLTIVTRNARGERTSRRPIVASEQVLLVQHWVSATDVREHSPLRPHWDEGILSRILFESSILLAASHSNAPAVLREAATAYKVDTEAITAKVKQDFAAKEKAKKTPEPAAKTVNKAA
jgi:hypothetical protein